MPGTYRTRAEELRQEGATNEDLRVFALLAIADQLKAQNEIEVIEIMIGRGVPTTDPTPSEADMNKIHRHLWKVLGWADVD